ncbi:MAG: hypothetical protein KDC34_19365 [Saprospiraceae bacterium]|nr:hypothetical protein [Saprospiraceae bacterium]
MSKDKGSKNNKKPKAEKTPGNKKAKSDYKSEGQKGKGQQTLEAFIPKTDKNSGGDSKKKK